MLLAVIVCEARKTKAGRRRGGGKKRGRGKKQQPVVVPEVVEEDIDGEVSSDAERQLFTELFKKS